MKDCKGSYALMQVNGAVSLSACHDARTEAAGSTRPLSPTSGLRSRTISGRTSSQESSSRGDKLPAEVDLARRYGVARMTVRRAIADLADNGEVVVLHGRGTFVAER